MRILLASIMVALLAGIANAAGTIQYAITQESPKGSGSFVATGPVFDTGTSDPAAALAAIAAPVRS
jgi:hypothetical protein